MGRCTRWRATLAVGIVGPMALAAGGCGGGSAGTSAHARRAPAAAVAAGCTTALPRRVAASPVGWNVLVRLCAAADGSKLLLRNASTTAVVRVSGTTPATTLAEQGGGAGGASLADQTAARIASAACSASACVVPPGHAVLASGAPASIDFEVVRTATVAVTAARSFATWTLEETPDGARLAGQIVSCAKAAGAHASGTTPWPAAFARAYAPRAACDRLVAAVMRDTGTGERPIVEVFENIARRLDAGTWADALAYGLARVSAR
jgi:hypothetical protein